MIFDDSLLQNTEKIVFSLRNLFSSSGYKAYRMSKFEEYDLYARNKDFLVSDNVITFTDTTGKLMALKPDVTLSIIKNTDDTPQKVHKVFYNENVYRVSKGTNAFKEIMQTGLECFGKVSSADVEEVILLAAKSLKMLSDKPVLSLSNLSLVERLIDDLGVSSQGKATLLNAIREKNLHEIKALCAEQNVADAKLNRLLDLLSIHGTIQEALPKITSILETLPSTNRFTSFTQLLLNLLKAEETAIIQVDFSVVDDVNYYNGIVFKGFIQEVPTAILSGGQYDNLMRKMGKKSKAIGFAVYTDYLERIDLSKAPSAETKDDYLNIALPKGRLGEKVYNLFAEAGFECPAVLEPTRKLIFENPAKKVRYFWVKPSDVAIYVERGAADIGVAGKDILLEHEPDIYELLDLDTGKCRMAVAAPNGFKDDPTRKLKVATKFTKIASKYYQSLGRDIDIIQLNGSIEIAPILGLSDVIVDIVETGTTLKENNLSVIETVVPISARLISNKASYKFKSATIDTIVQKLSELK